MSSPAKKSQQYALSLTHPPPRAHTCSHRSLAHPSSTRHAVLYPLSHSQHDTVCSLYIHHRVRGLEGIYNSSETYYLWQQTRCHTIAVRFQSFTSYRSILFATSSAHSLPIRFLLSAVSLFTTSSAYSHRHCLASSADKSCVSSFPESTHLL